MTHSYVIIGGGVAGLTAALRLTQLGIAPIILEGGSYPSHKVCGEFLSPEGYSLLQRWGIDSVPIAKACLYTKTKPLSFTFPSSAGSLSHLSLDIALLQKAIAGNARLLDNTKVLACEYQGKGYRILLSTGETLLADNLIIASGKIPLTDSPIRPPLVYHGIKAHYSGINLDNTLEMYICEGAYLGISPIEEGKCNIACLASNATFERYGSASGILDHFRKQHPRLESHLAQGNALFGEWMCSRIPAFGLRKTLKYPQAYFIGDAAGGIPPASGCGLTMAICGGVLAAEYAVKRDAFGFNAAWQRICRKPIFWAKKLHYIMLRPLAADYSFMAASRCPSLAKHLFQLTRLNISEKT